MTSDAIPFCAALCQGAKRTIRRAHRFVFLELCLEARRQRRAGVIVLPPPHGNVRTDAARVACALGGGATRAERDEIAAAVEALAQPLALGDEPMIRFEGDDATTARRVVIPSWARWVRAGRSGAGGGADEDVAVDDDAGGNHELPRASTRGRRHSVAVTSPLRRGDVATPSPPTTQVDVITQDTTGSGSESGPFARARAVSGSDLFSGSDLGSSSLDLERDHDQRTSTLPEPDDDDDHGGAARAERLRRLWARTPGQMPGPEPDEPEPEPEPTAPTPTPAAAFPISAETVAMVSAAAAGAGVLPHVDLGPGTDKARREAAVEAQVETILGYWADRPYHARRPKLTPKRRKVVRARLAEGWSPRELCQAVAAAAGDDWLMGRAQGSPGYRGIETILGEAGRIERLILRHERSRGGGGGGAGSPGDASRPAPGPAPLPRPGVELPPTAPDPRAGAGAGATTRLGFEVHSGGFDGSARPPPAAADLARALGLGLGAAPRRQREGA